MRFGIKVICFVMSMVIAFSFSSAEEGVFVPTYATFMDRLCEHSPEGYMDVLRIGMMQDGVWKEGYMSSYNLVGKNIFQVSRNVSNGYVDSFEISLSEEVYTTYKNDFNAFITAIMMAIRNDYTPEDVATMKETLLITTITSTPVDYMYQSANDGVYRYGFLKRYGSYIFSIEFALQ